MTYRAESGSGDACRGSESFHRNPQRVGEISVYIVASLRTTSETEVMKPRAKTSHSVLGEREFDLGERRRVSRSEIRPHPWMLFQELLRASGFMSGEIIQNYVED